MLFDLLCQLFRVTQYHFLSFTDDDGYPKGGADQQRVLMLSLTADTAEQACRTVPEIVGQLPPQAIAPPNRVRAWTCLTAHLSLGEAKSFGPRTSSLELRDIFYEIFVLHPFEVKVHYPACLATQWMSKLQSSA